MDSPAASLHDDLALIDDALEPFTGPQIEERPGLRWMRQTLTQRRAHIVRQIAETERSTLTVRLRSASGTASIAVPTITALLDALQQTLLATADEIAWPDAFGDAERHAALTLEPGDAEATDEHWQIALHRRAGPLRSQPVTTDGDRLAVDAALATLLDALAQDAGDIGRIVATSGLTVDLATAPVAGAARDLTIDRHTMPAAG
jgi:hypothetical protein